MVISNPSLCIQVFLNRFHDDAMDGSNSAGEVPDCSEITFRAAAADCVFD